MKRSVISLALTLILLGAPALLANEQKTGDNGRLPGVVASVRPMAEPIVAQAHTQEGATQVITYDDGIANTAPATGSLCYGNRFDTALGLTVNQYSVTQLTFFVATSVGSAAFVSVFGAPSGTTAPVLGSVNVPLNNGPGAFNTATIGPYTGMGSFLAGVWYGGGDVPALGTGTANGQGFHGMAINDIAGTGFQILPGLNGLVRATTSALPVELLGFSVSDEN